MRTILAGFIISVCCAQMVAADPVAAKGVGVTTCAEFLQKYRADPELAETVYFSWAQGFMSGWNFELLNLKRPIRDLSSQSMEQQQVRSYCSQRPSATFSEAALKLYLTLQERPFP